jgi:hypothetical protein
MMVEYCIGIRSLRDEFAFSEALEKKSRFVNPFFDFLPWLFFDSWRFMVACCIL